MCNRHLLALVAGASLLVASPVLAEKTAGQTVDDTTLAAQTKTALIDSDKVSAGHINVEVYKGHVQLGGFVDSESEKANAIAAARRIDGVVKVHDSMVVMKGHRSLGQTLDDATIQTTLKAKLADVEGMDKAIAINTEVKQGEVLLTGWVHDAKSKNQAGEIAGGISGVKKVHNRIALKP